MSERYVLIEDRDDKRYYAAGGFLLTTSPRRAVVFDSREKAKLYQEMIYPELHIAVAAQSVEVTP